MVLPKNRAEALGVDELLVLSLHVQGAHPSNCPPVKVGLRFLEVFPSWCCCLGVGASLLPFTCLDIGQVKAWEAFTSLTAVANGLVQ